MEMWCFFLVCHNLPSNLAPQNQVSRLDPNEPFVLHLQSGNVFLPTDDKGSILSSKYTFLDAWEVSFSFSKCAQKKKKNSGRPPETPPQCTVLLLLFISFLSLF